jgi:outer membrane receptor for ferrienterochelin and colicin
MKKSTFIRMPVLAGAALFASANYAQTPPKTNDIPTLPAVIVSASRMAQALETAPIGASVILGETLRAAGMADANVALRKLGGVAARSDQTLSLIHI